MFTRRIPSYRVKLWYSIEIGDKLYQSKWSRRIVLYNGGSTAKPACLGSMDLASGQSRGLLHFLPSKLSPRGVVRAFTSATAKALSIRSRLRVSPSSSLLLPFSHLLVLLRVLPRFTLARSFS